MMLALLACYMGLMPMLLMRTVKPRFHLYGVCLVRIEALSSLSFALCGEYIFRQVKEALH